MMTYKEWDLLTTEELNGIAVDYIDPQGKTYSEPFCFYTLEEALDYAKMRIDQSIRSKSLQHQGAEAVQSRVIS
jgi:hypothetical protein